MIDLKGKTVLVTGASRGIGAATALTLARCGATVIGHYGRSSAEAQRLAETIRLEARGSCDLLKTDLSLPGAGFDLWRKALGIADSIDVLVNNAGIIHIKGLEDPESQWSKAWTEALQVNLAATADLCRAAIDHFRRKTTDPKGIIVNLASRGAQRGVSFDRAQYAASKAGVIALTKSIARDFAADRIYAFAVSPGFVASDMANQSIAAYGLEAVLSDLPMGEIAPPQDVANTIAFLASGLVPHMTGATLDINGASYAR